MPSTHADASSRGVIAITIDGDLIVAWITTVGRAESRRAAPAIGDGVRMLDRTYNAHVRECHMWNGKSSECDPRHM